MTPLLCRVYPNGKADVNHFHAAGGMGFLIRELLGAGLLHRDVDDRAGAAGSTTTRRSRALGADGELLWRDGAAGERRHAPCCAVRPSRSSRRAG